MPIEKCECCGEKIPSEGQMHIHLHETKHAIRVCANCHGMIEAAYSKALHLSL